MRWESGGYKDRERIYREGGEGEIEKFCLLTLCSCNDLMQLIEADICLFMYVHFNEVWKRKYMMQFLCYPFEYIMFAYVYISKHSSEYAILILSYLLSFWCEKLVNFVFCVLGETFLNLIINVTYGLLMNQFTCKFMVTISSLLQFQQTILFYHWRCWCNLLTMITVFYI